jgi:nucleotide-binding universal stress UspA family protein
MSAVLAPVESAAKAPAAAQRAIAYCLHSLATVHLLNVQRPFPRHVSRFCSNQELQRFHQEAGMSVLAPAIRALDAAGVPHVDHVVVGQPARAIVEFAARKHCDDILLDEAPGGFMSILHAASLSSQVRHLMRAATAAAAAGPTGIR